MPAICPWEKIKKHNKINVFYNFCPNAHRDKRIEKVMKVMSIPNDSEKSMGRWADFGQIAESELDSPNMTQNSWAFYGQITGSVRPEWADESGMGAITQHSTITKEINRNDKPTISSIMQSTPDPHI